MLPIRSHRPVTIQATSLLSNRKCMIDASARMQKNAPPFYERLPGTSPRRTGHFGHQSPKVQLRINITIAARTGVPRPNDQSAAKI